MPTTMNRREVVDRLMLEVQKAGSQTALAKKWKCSQTYISQVVNNLKMPGAKLCRHMKIVREDRTPKFLDVSDV